MEVKWAGPQSFPAPQVCCPPSTSTCSIEALQAPSLGFYGRFIMWTWLIKSLAIGDWTQPPAPLPFPVVKGWDRKFQPFNNRVGSSGHQPSPSTSHFLNTNSSVVEGLAVKNKSCFYHVYHSGIPRVPGGLCQKPGTKPNINLLYCIRRSVPGTKTKHIVLSYVVSQWWRHFGWKLWVQYPPTHAILERWKSYEWLWWLVCYYHLLTL